MHVGNYSQQNIRGEGTVFGMLRSFKIGCIHCRNYVDR